MARLMSKPATPNHALQPTGVHVTAHAAHHLRPPPPSPAHGPRHARPWLSLGSLGVARRPHGTEDPVPKL